MLLLTFRSGENLYALDSRQVVEVIPRVALRSIPHAPAHVLGLLSYRGNVVPVVDFGLVTGGDTSRVALSTRLIMTEYAAPGSGRRKLGIVAERVEEVVRGDEARVVMPGMDLEEAPYLGGVYRIGERLVQVVKPERVLDARLQAALYADSAEAG